MQTSDAIKSGCEGPEVRVHLACPEAEREISGVTATWGSGRGTGGEVREVARGEGGREWVGSYKDLGPHGKNFGFSSESDGSGAREVFEQRSQGRI